MQKIKLIEGKRYCYYGTYEAQAQAQSIGRQLKRDGNIDSYRAIQGEQLQYGYKYDLYVGYASEMSSEEKAHDFESWIYAAQQYRKQGHSDTKIKEMIGGSKEDFEALDDYEATIGSTQKKSEPKHYPKPDYDRCNAGHQLVEVYDEKRNAYVWDCPICIKKMQDAETCPDCGGPAHNNPEECREYYTPRG